MADIWDLTGVWFGFFCGFVLGFFFFVAGVIYKEYAESSLMLDISTSKTVLDTGTGLASAGTRGWCCRVGKQRDYLNAFWGDFRGSAQCR